ncbi:MAG: hypothetical protein ABIY70_15615 [Capsulimonas sp.]|uniref:hypothetical protein n=1 Tax=Capsulimonas sp. TaxID=2494211 RepID=UPI0032673AB2
MMVCIHAAVGAAIGGSVQRPLPALASGIASHLICDLFPHRDYDIKIEAPLAALMFGWLAKRYGVQSPQFLGAVGAVLPDAENALAVLGVIPRSAMIFPTHCEGKSWFAGHGKKLESPASQIALAAIALALADRSAGQ